MQEQEGHKTQDVKWTISEVQSSHEKHHLSQVVAQTNKVH